MQAQIFGRVKGYRVSRIILAAVAGLGLVVASVIGIQALTDGQDAAETQEFRTVDVQSNVGPDVTTLNLDRDRADVEPAPAARPSRGVDTTTLYLDRDGADVSASSSWGGSDYAGSTNEAASGSDRKLDLTTLNLDRDGADVVAD